MSPRVGHAVLAAVALAPAYFNDFLYMRAESVFDWLAADYGSKILIVALILILHETRRAVAGAWNGSAVAGAWNFGALRERDWFKMAGWAIAVAALSVAAFVYVKPPLDALAPGMALFDYPDIDNPTVRVFDLTAGLVLTAVAEELGFRALLGRVIERFTANPQIIVIASAALFAAIHWSNGLGSLAVSFLAGAMLMMLYLRGRSLWPPVVAHYLADLVLFL